MAWGQYGNRVGVPSILKLLAKHAVPATFYVPGVVALLYGDEQRRIIGEGHEIGIHSWIHELNSVLAYEAERDLVLRAADVLEKTTKVRPVGARTASWDFSPHTLRITREAGLLYDSSLMADVDCYELLLDGEPTGVIELPVEWIRDDAVYFMMHRFQGLRPYTPPSDVFDVFRREFEAAYEEGGIFQLTCHPHMIAYRSRLWIIEELIRLAKAKGDVWFAKHADVVRYARGHGRHRRCGRGHVRRRDLEIAKRRRETQGRVEKRMLRLAKDGTAHLEDRQDARHRHQRCAGCCSLFVGSAA